MYKVGGCIPLMDESLLEGLYWIEKKVWQSEISSLPSYRNWKTQTWKQNTKFKLSQWWISLVKLTLDVGTHIVWTEHFTQIYPTWFVNWEVMKPTPTLKCGMRKGSLETTVSSMRIWTSVWFKNMLKKIWQSQNNSLPSYHDNWNWTPRQKDLWR